MAKRIRWVSTSRSDIKQIARFYTPGTESAYFGIIGAVAIVGGILLFTVKEPIKKLMGSIH